MKLQNLLTMKSSSRLPISALIVFFLLRLAPAYGDTLNWTTDGSGTTITDGAGAWTGTTGNFTDGVSHYTWSNSTNSGDIAKFGGGSAGTTGSVTITGTVTPAGLSFVAPFAGTFYTLNGGTIALQGAAPTIAFTTAATINSALSTGSGSNLAISGTAAGLTALTLGATGSIGGTVSITGSNVYVLLGGANNSLAGASTITVGSGAMLRYSNPFNVSAATSFNLNGTGVGSRGALSFYGGSAATISGNITLSGNTSIATRSAGLDLAGDIGESGGARTLTLVCDTGSTTTTLSGNNTFSGGLTFNVSSSITNVVRFKAGSNTAFGTGTLSMDANSYAVGGSSIIDLNGKTITVGGLSGGAASHFIESGSGAATLTVNNSANNTFSGIIRDGAGTVALTKGSTGTLTLNATNTYTGGTTLNQGTLTVGTAGTLAGSTAALAVNNTNTGAGTAVILNLSTAADTTAGSLSGTIASPTSGNNTATINTQTGRNFTVNQTANGAYAGVIAGAGNFILGSLSTNTLTLTGTNTYTGTTTVTSGTLVISGSSTGGGAYAVNSGGTLGGTGTIGLASNQNVVVSAGGKVQASSFDRLDLALSGTGTLDVSGALGSGTGSMLFTLDAPTSTVVAIAGTLNIGSNVLNFDDFTFSTTGNFAAGAYKLFGGASGLTGTLGSSLIGTVGGLNSTISIVNNEVILTAVPEPATWALLAFSLTTVVVLRRRRNS